MNQSNNTTNKEKKREKQTVVRNVSKRIVQPVLKYLDDRYGEPLTDVILREINLDRLYFDDLNGYMPLQNTEELFNSAIKHTGDTDFPYAMGRNLIKYMPPIQRVMVTVFATPALLFQNAEKAEQQMVRTTRIKTEKVSSNQFRLTVSHAGGYKEPPSACRNRHGTYEALSTAFGLPFSKVTHPKCAFRGDEHCVYEVTVPSYPFPVLAKLSLFCSFLAFVLALIGLVIQSSPLMIAAAVLVPCAIIAYAIHAETRHSSTLNWEKNVAQAVEENNKKLREEIQKTQHIHDLTVKLNRSIHSDFICKEVVRAVHKNLGYGSCHIWLVDHRDTLQCAVVDGLSEDQERIVHETKYSVSEGLKHSEGFVVRVLKNKDMLLVNDIKAATGGFTERSKKLFAALRLSSIIIVPLVDKDHAFGMLVGAHHDGKKVDYIDKVSFESLALIVSNSLAKARMYESMERRIEKRTLSIEQSQKDLLLAKEMSVQSEKLSALGQMAAGVAHEINNPLNFLVNIIPELRQDVVALQKIYMVAKEHLSGDRLARLGGIVAPAELDSHLEESEYVFELINRSLKKARKTVYSLKVFARTAETGNATKEKLYTIVQEVFDLIPPKYRSDITCTIDVDKSLMPSINRAEITQVLLSLMRNAIETQHGKGEIVVTGTIDNKWIYLTVKDEGPGVPEDLRENIMRPFFTTKNRNKHSGLGLTIAEEIIKKYGGSISIENQETGGAEVNVVFLEQRGQN